MHIFFSGIGGTGIGPLALLAKEAGFKVSGSDKQDSQYVEYLRKHGIKDIYIGQKREDIDKLHQKLPIDWYVYSSAVAKENPDAPELQFVREQGIKMSKRDELLNLILREKNLKLIAVAGTHGKTTTTAMVVWLFKQLGLPISYSVGAKISFGDMGAYDKKSEYFVYEADEFDRNFLAFEPFISVITGVSWDHHEIFPTREDYQQAFIEFIRGSKWTIIWQEDYDYLGLADDSSCTVQDSGNKQIQKIKLDGHYNRLDGWLAIQAVHEVTNTPVDKLIAFMGKFPGSQRRMEEIVPGLYSDYAHTPEKIRGAMSAALEKAQDGQGRKSLRSDKKKASTATEPYKKYGEDEAEVLTKSGTKRTPSGDVVVVYEPLTNRRQHYMMDYYKDCFEGAKKVYWLPSYLAREDPKQRIISPSELIQRLDDPSIAKPMERDHELKRSEERRVGKDCR